MQTVTYSLKCNNQNSNEYYRDVRIFTDELMVKAGDSLIPEVEDYIKFLQRFNLEEIRNFEEYVLELLSFGILWRTYSGTALKVKTAPFITLSLMSEWRKKHQKIKPLIDITRGILFTLFLLPKKTQPLNTRPPSLSEIDHVCKWFEATGEFREQALRFIRWRAYWFSLSEEELNKLFLTIREFTDWFLINSEKHLGKYTDNVEIFLKSATLKYRWREDRIQCSRTRNEYHLNMAGAELMNRAFRKEFQDTEKKFVLVPGCMRAHTNEECLAKKVKQGMICRDCTPKCNVNRLSHMGKKYNFDVFIIPHASDLSLWAPREGKEKAGIIATACVTTLVEGGWELKRYDVPAQCVLLDCSGCKKHWHPEGIPTNFNIGELKRLLRSQGSFL